MRLYDVVLFLHIATLLGAIGLSGILHASEWLARGATSVAELRTNARPQPLGKLFPVFILGLFGFGSWLLHLSGDRFHWRDGWVWTAIVALVILGACGGLILDKHTKAYGALLATSPDGPITDAVRAKAFDTRVWTVSHFNTALALSVVLNMVTKPSTAVAITVLVVGSGIGGVVGMLGARSALSRQVAPAST